MKEKLKAQFMPRDCEQTSYQRVQNLRQREKTVKEYTREFHRLSLRSNLAESENQRVTQYLNGLQTGIQDQVSLQRPYKMSDAYQLALIVEAQLAHNTLKRPRNDYRRGPSSSQSNNSIWGGRTAAPTRLNQQTSPGNGKGIQTQQSTQGQTNIKCYRCFEVGHKSTECPKRANAHVNLAEDDEALDEIFVGRDDGNQYLEENEVDADEEEGIDGDLVGETLVKIP